jgi:hypothetical protein
MRTERHARPASHRPPQEHTPYQDTTARRAHPNAAAFTTQERSGQSIRHITPFNPKEFSREPPEQTPPARVARHVHLRSP